MSCHKCINGVTDRGTIITIVNRDLDPETTTSTEFGAYYDKPLPASTPMPPLFHNKIQGPRSPLATRWPTHSAAVNAGWPLFQKQKVNVRRSRLDPRPGTGWQLGIRTRACDTERHYTYTTAKQKSRPENRRPLTNYSEPPGQCQAENWQTTDRLESVGKTEYRLASVRASPPSTRTWQNATVAPPPIRSHLRHAVARNTRPIPCSIWAARSGPSRA